MWPERQASRSGRRPGRLRVPRRLLKPLPYGRGSVLFLCLLAAPAAAEKWNYSVYWPSGHALGEAWLSRETSASGVNAQLTLEASFPGLPIKDEFTTRATKELCSLEFTKESHHGTRKASEVSSFDQERNLVKRSTRDGGGKTELQAPRCARDALAFLLHVQRELAAGRLPATSTIFFGAPYRIALTMAGRQTIDLGGQPVECDQVTAAIQGPASEIGFELFFARDAARTLARVRLPLPVGAFTLDLNR